MALGTIETTSLPRHSYRYILPIATLLSNKRSTLLTGRTAATAVVAGGTALAAYLDAKFHISKDLSSIARLKKGERDYKQAGTYVKEISRMSRR